MHSEHAAHKKRTILGILKDAAVRWNDDDAQQMGASLSYYTAFSIAPLLILTMALVAIFFGHDQAQGKIIEQLTNLAGPQSADAIQNMLVAAQKPVSGTIATVCGIIALIIGSSAVMMDLKNSLNKIWRVQAARGIGGFFKDRLLSLGMVLVVGFLLLVSLVLSAFLSALGTFFGGVLPGPKFFLQVFNFLLSFCVITLLFASIFKGLPDAKIRWHDVWIGAVITAVLFSVGKFLLGLYIGKGAVASSYGAAGSLLILLLWVYYSAQIVYFGAEVTKIYADQFGSGIKPSNVSVAKKLVY